MAEQYAKLQENPREPGYRFAPERLTDFFTEILHIPLTGKPTTPDEGDRMLEVTGVGQILDDPYTGAPNTDVGVEHVWEWFEKLAFEQLKRLVADSTMAQRVLEAKGGQRGARFTTEWRGDPYIGEGSCCSLRGRTGSRQPWAYLCSACQVSQGCRWMYDN